LPFIAKKININVNLYLDIGLFSISGVLSTQNFNNLSNM